MELTDSGTMVSMGALLEKRGITQKTRTTERGELLKYFAGKIGKNIRYVAFKVTKMSVQDLYYIKSDCDQAESRGIPWGAAFYTSIKPR